MTDQQIIPITQEAFGSRLGAVFNVRNIDVQVELTLLEVEDSTKGRPWPPSLRKPFIMIFSGPRDVVLMEGPRMIAAPDGAICELYLIPIVTPDPGANSRHYQAVIN